MMTQEQIEKCLDFAEGKKGKFTILMTKKPEFPEVLLTGTEKQRAIHEYVEQGYSTRQIADMMKCTQPNIVEHMRQYRRGKEFYDEWNEFWETMKDVRSISILVAFESVLTKEELEKYQSKGIHTVGDYLHLAVTMKSTRLCSMLGENEAEKNRKAEIFKCIRQLCNKTLQSKSELQD